MVIRCFPELPGSIREVFRGDDVLGRIGGDEFAILMKNCKTEQIVREKAGQLCQKLAALFDDSVSCSIGVSFYAKDGTYFYQLYQNADIALYQSKRQGKNQVQFYLPSMKQESWTVNSTEIDELRTEMPVIAAAPGLEEHLTSQLLEELNDVIYVSDPKTYELLFINRTIKKISISSTTTSARNVIRCCRAAIRRVRSAPTTS